MPAATVTTTSSTVGTIPRGATAFWIDNESDTAIRIRFNKKAATSGSDMGKVLPAAADGVPSTFAFSFTKPLKADMKITAIHAGSGDKSLTYDWMDEPGASE